jgi:P27 family predicted phage terminase small subunit
MTNPDSGHTSAHPCVSVANTAAGQLRAFANEFGLSPVAERKLGSITPPDDESENPYGGG